MAMGHLFRYMTLVRILSQDESPALWNFPFSLATDSYALSWFAKLPHESVASWTDLVEAFIARFHDYTVKVTPEQMETMRPLSCETTAEFIMRWMDMRMRCYHPHSETHMVRECIAAMKGTYPPVVTFAELLKQVPEQELELPYLIHVSCDMYGRHCTCQGGVIN